MKLKKKKSLIAILVLFLVIGVTIAYYTSNTTFENVFNTGLYKVVVTEEFESPDNWAPGEFIPKTVTSTNEGTVPAAVRISYTEQWLDEEENDITSQVSPNPAIINFANTNDWTLSNGYYYYKYILEPTDETSSFISGVTLDPNLDSVTCTGEGNEKTCEAQNPASGAKYKLTFTIQTVQADKYDTVWNTEVEITVKNSGSSSNEQSGDPALVNYTMNEMCPGCVFTINKIDQGFMTGEVVSTGTTTDYSSFNRRTFVGLVLDGDNKVTRHFACGIYQKPATNEDIPFCVEGTSDSLIHSRNVSILNKIFGQGNYNDQNETWDWSENDSNWYWVDAYPYDNHSSYSVNLDYSGDEGFVSCDGYGSSIYTS